MSIVLTGLDQDTWTAYCVTDNYFDPKASSRFFREETGPEGVDPLSRGNLPSKYPIWSPKLYFLQIMACQLEWICTEWGVVISALWKAGNE